MRLLAVLFILCSGIDAVLAKSYIDGLHFMKSPALLIERQEISLSLEQISSSYLLKNNSNSDITETVVFTLPVPNHFNITVDDKPVNYSIVSRAISSNGIDISNILQELGLPFDPVTAIHSIDSSANRDSLRNKLINSGLIDQKDEEPRWFVKTFYYWQQNFPGNSETNVRYSYKPRTMTKNLKFKGASDLLKLPFRLVKKIFLQNEELENIQAQIEKHNPQIKEFCPKLADYSVLDISSSLIPTKELYYEQYQEDIWANSINNFKLTIESPPNMQAMLCWQGELKPIKNNTLSFSARNYVPLQDIRVLYVAKAAG